MPNNVLTDNFTHGQLMLLYVWLRVFTSNCGNSNFTDGSEKVKPLMESLTEIIYKEIVSHNTVMK